MPFSFGQIPHVSFPNDPDGTKHRHESNLAGRPIKSTCETFEDFERFLQTGRSLTPSVFTDNKRDLANLRSTDLWICDIDDVLEDTTWDKWLERAVVKPALIIKSGSHDYGSGVEQKNKGAYRAVYLYARSLRPGEAEAAADFYTHYTKSQNSAVDVGVSKNVAVFFYGCKSEENVLWRGYNEGHGVLNPHSILEAKLEAVFGVDVDFNENEIYWLGCVEDSTRRQLYGYLKKPVERHEFARNVCLQLETNLTALGVTEHDRTTLLERVRVMVRPDDDSQEAARQTTDVQDYAASLIPSLRVLGQTKHLTQSNTSIEQATAIRQLAGLLQQTDNNICFAQLLKESQNIAWAQAHFNQEGRYTGAFDLQHDSELCGLTATEYEQLSNQAQKSLRLAKQNSVGAQAEATRELVLQDDYDILNGIGIHSFCVRHTQNLQNDIVGCLPIPLAEAYLNSTAKFPAAAQFVPFFSALGVIGSSLTCPVLHSPQTIRTAADLIIRTTNEPPNIFNLLIGEPGSGKTPCIDNVAEPLRAIDNDRRKDRRKTRNNIAKHNAQIAKFQKSDLNSTANNREQELKDAIATQNQNLIDQISTIEITAGFDVGLEELSPIDDRFFTGAATVQELIAQCAENQHNSGKEFVRDGAAGLWWLTDEGSGPLAGFKTAPAFLAATLQLSNGSGLVSESLAARSQKEFRDTEARHTAVSITWGIQPGPLKKYLAEIDYDNQKGLANRFIITGLDSNQRTVAAFDPDTLSEHEHDDENSQDDLDAQFRQACLNAYTEALQRFPRPDDTFQGILNGHNTLHRQHVHCDREAKHKIRLFFWELEACTNDAEHWRVHVTKARSYLFKLAVCIALSKAIKHNTQHIVIDMDTANAACSIVAASLQHHYTIMGTEISPAPNPMAPDNSEAIDRRKQAVLAIALEDNEKISWQSCRKRLTRFKMTAKDFEEICKQLHAEGKGQAQTRGIKRGTMLFSAN